MLWWLKRRKGNEDICNEVESLKRQMFILLSNVREMRQDVLECKELGYCLDRTLQSTLAGINKTLSSIEMELLMQRGACLDNNFPGKEDL